MTDAPGVYLIMRYADCVPVLFFDPVRRAVGIAHAGWRGTLALVAQRTALAMVDQFGCAPANIRAAIGPSIGPCCYEVGDEVVAETRTVFGDEADSLLPPGPRRRHLDLWAANRAQLHAIGLQHLETAEICTSCHVEDYFSHRAEAGRTGRFGAMIGLV
jgi:YfiH family protein